MRTHFTLMIVCSLIFHATTQSSWAEDTLATLSRTEKIGQLIAARIESSYTPAYLEQLAKTYHVGAFIPLQYWTLAEHNSLIDNLHNLYPNTLLSPVLVIEDAEWGINMHIPEVPAFPKAMTLAATHNTNLIYRVGYAIGTQCAAIGVQMNLAPVVDVNDDAQNPVIGMRSFGDNTATVTTYALAYARGLNDASIMPCLKHFPGHGNTHTDPHLTLPVLTKPLDSEEKKSLFCPFFDIMQQLPCSVMVGHIAYPALEPDNTIKPASCSRNVVNLLTPTLNSNALIISDALNMGALIFYGDPGDIALQALKAGIDILLCPPDIEAAIKRIGEALETGEYTEAELDAHVLKILRVKETLLLHLPHRDTKVPLALYEDLIQEAYDAAATPSNGFEAFTAAYETVILGSPKNPQAPFYDPTRVYTEPLCIYLYPGSHKIHRLSDEQKTTLATIAQQQPESKIVLFGSPYCLMDIPSTLQTLVVYEDTPFTHHTAGKVITGELVPQGILPVEIEPILKKLQCE